MLTATVENMLVTNIGKTHSGTESQISGQNIKPQLFCSKIPHSGVFGVADFKFEVRFSKNKMATTKWRTLFKNFGGFA